MSDQSSYVELVLTCGSWQEAQKIADVLLEKHLVACVEFFEIKSKYWWEHQLEENTEIKLMMHSKASNFDQAEAEIKLLHSYETFVLIALPAERVSGEAATWLNDNLKIG